VINIRRLFLLLVSIVFFLVLMHFFPEKLSSTIHNRFDLDAEANIPTWYSTVLLFAVFLSSLGIYILNNDHLYFRKFWLVFSCVYCYLSIDEAARLHEIIDETAGVKWVLLYAPFAAAFFLMCVYHLLNCSDKTLRNLILGGLIVYALGGLIGELIFYLFAPLAPGLQQLEFVLEEGFEMVGSIIVLMGCLRELNRLWNPDNQKRIAM
jgi:hypothetical protein